MGTMIIKLPEWNLQVHDQKMIHMEFVHALMLYGIDTSNVGREQNAAVTREVVHNRTISLMFQHANCMQPKEAARAWMYFEPETDIVDQDDQDVNVLDFYLPLKATILWAIRISVNEPGIDFASRCNMAYDPNACVCTLAQLDPIILELTSGPGARHNEPQRKLANPVKLDLFNFGQESWFNWKLHCFAQLRGAGVIQIIEDKEYAKQNPVLSAIVAGLIQSAFASKGDYIPVAFMEDPEIINDGYKMWKRLIEYFEHPEMLQSMNNQWVAELKKLTYKDQKFDQFAQRFLSIHNVLIMIAKMAKEKKVTISHTEDWKSVLLSKVETLSEFQSEALNLHRDDNATLWDCICRLRGVAFHNKLTKSDNQTKTSEEKTAKEKTPDKSSSSMDAKQVLKQQLLKELRMAKDDTAKEAIQKVLTLAGFPKPGKKDKKEKKRHQMQTKDDESGKDLNDLDKAAIKQKFDEDLKPKKSKKKKSKKSEV